MPPALWSRRSWRSIAIVAICVSGTSAFMTFLLLITPQAPSGFAKSEEAAQLVEPSRLRRRLAGLGTSATDAEMEDVAMSSLTATSHFKAAWVQFEPDELSSAARAPSNSGSNSIAENPQLVHFRGSASSNADRDDNAALGSVPTKGYRVTDVGSTPLGSLAPHVEASSHSSILLRLGPRMGSLLPLLIAPSEAPTPSPPTPSVPSDSPLSSVTVKPQLASTHPGST